MRHTIFAFLGFLFVLVLGGCAASLPKVPSVTESTPLTSPEIVGSKGKLTETRAKAVLSREGQGGNAEELIKKTAALMESVGGRSHHPLMARNKIILLIDGPATYEAMFKAIEGAKDHVNFETFVFSDDKVGRKFADLLLRKQAEGVQVNLIYGGILISRSKDRPWQRFFVQTWRYQKGPPLADKNYFPGKDFADKMEELFEQDLKESDQVTAEKWSQRPVLTRIKEFFSRLLAPGL